jgi:N-acetyl-gamma-glutamyl-phosphate reductase
MIRAGIVGFRGYSGAELIEILHRHGGVKVHLMEHRADAGDRPVPRGFAGPARIAATPEAARAAGLEVVFLATPPEVSMELAPGFLEAGAKVIDLSGAFRLRTVENYARWYKEEHTQPGLLAEAV